MREPKRARNVQCKNCGTMLTAVNGRWLRYVRRRAGISLNAMVKRTGVPKTTLHNVETNLYRPNVELLGHYGKLEKRAKE